MDPLARDSRSKSIAYGLLSHDDINLTEQESFKNSSSPSSLFGSTSLSGVSYPPLHPTEKSPPRTTFKQPFENLLSSESVLPNSMPLNNKRPNTIFNTRENFEESAHLRTGYLPSFPVSSQGFYTETQEALLFDRRDTEAFPYIREIQLSLNDRQNQPRYQELEDSVSESPKFTANDGSSLDKQRTMHHLNRKDGFFVNGQHFVTEKNPTISEEDFLRVATNPQGVTYKDKINLYIQKKFEAGLLKPFMYHQSYIRMQAYMEMHLTPSGYSRVFSLLESVRPGIRDIVERMSEMDMLIEEEAFQRLSMDYDRYLSAISVPCALWRRTGEIVRVNQSFLDLIGSSRQSFWKTYNRGKSPAIYEYLSEDSFINYWERYAGVCFDDSQKAVLTRAFLKKSSTSNNNLGGVDVVSSPFTHVPCLFSFTIRRDPYKLARLIIGQFIPVTS